MLRITLKGVRGHLLRFLLTVASVTLGTALIAGTYVLTDSINATFDSILDESSAYSDVVVRGQSAGTITGGVTTMRSQLPVSLVDQIRPVDGVARVTPDYQGSIVLVGKNGTAVRSGGAPTLGLAYFPNDPTLTLVSGRPPKGPSEVAVASSTLALSQLKVGDRTQALVGGTPTPVTVTAEVTFGASMAGATLVLVDEATARAAFAPDGQVQSFTIVADPGVTEAQLRDRIAAVLPATAEAVTAEVSNEEAKKQLRDELGFISIFLLVFAGVSVFVGAFIIANTFSILVTQRTRELALLRTIGASRRQVLGVVLGEAVVVGLAGGLVGLLTGIGLARGLQALFGTFGLEISAGLPVHVRTVVVTVAVGLLVTVLSAVHPALRASRVAPMAALRDDLVQPVSSVRRGGIVGLALTAAGLVVTTMVAQSEEVNWWLFLTGVALLLFGVLGAAPLAARPVIRAVTWPFEVTLGVVGRLARENGLRIPRRTTTTASALMIGLTLMAGISVIAQSMKASVASVVEQQLTADFVLDGGQVPFSPEVADAVKAVPGVSSVAGIAIVYAQSGTDTFQAVATDAGTIEQNLNVTMDSGSLASLDSGKIVVDGKVAKSHGWTVGSVVTTTMGSLRDRPLTIGGIAHANSMLGAQMSIPRSLYDEAVPAGQRGDYQVYVKAAPGADLTAVRAGLVDKVKPYLVVSVQDGEEFTNAQAKQVNTMLTVLYVLLALSVTIAVLGIVNTLALSVFERTREIGLLRAVGLGRRQLSMTITIEAVATALFGAVLGAGLGLGLGIALRRSLANDGLEVLAIPWTTLGALIVAAAVAGVIAAVLPAIRAVRLDVLRAITTE